MGMVLHCMTWMLLKVRSTFECAEEGQGQIQSQACLNAFHSWQRNHPCFIHKIQPLLVPALISSYLFRWQNVTIHNQAKVILCNCYCGTLLATSPDITTRSSTETFPRSFLYWEVCNPVMHMWRKPFWLACRAHLPSLQKILLVIPL